MSDVDSVMENSISAGLDYILGLQAEDGSWTEWESAAGRSDIWATAYVGYKLQSLPLESAVRAAPHVAAAARWLSVNAFADGGWGYNYSTESDADSTSCAILFLASAGWQVSERAYLLLADFQGADGGFATYRALGEPHSWNISHPDVTPTALLAMLTRPEPDRDAAQRGIDCVLRDKTPLGLWNSFWWSSCLYGTEASLSLLGAAGIEMPPPAGLAQIEPANAFEEGLLVCSLLHVDRDGSRAMIQDLVDKLVAGQRPDGSWGSAGILRLTRRDCYEPWASGDPGQLCEEPNRLFTTATVLRALSEFRACRGSLAQQPPAQ